jgi:hypothetical protein
MRSSLSAGSLPHSSARTSERNCQGAPGSPGYHREAGQQARVVAAAKGEHHGDGQADVLTQVTGRMPGGDLLDRDEAPVQFTAPGVAEHAGCLPAGPHWLIASQVRLDVCAHPLPGQQEVAAVMRWLVAGQLTEQCAAEDAALVIGGRGEAGRQQQVRLAAGQPATGMHPGGAPQSRPRLRPAAG